MSDGQHYVENMEKKKKAKKLKSIEQRAMVIQDYIVSHFKINELAEELAKIGIEDEWIA